MLLWIFMASLTPAKDTDFWWHLRTGEFILEHGMVPFVDLFTFMDADKPWIDLHWGFQVLVTLLYRLGGISLVIVAKGLVLAVAAGIACAASGSMLPNWIKALIWIAPAIALTGRAFERPEILSLLFLSLWLWIVPQLPQRPSLAWWLPLVQLVWVNCHSLFALGPVVAVAFVIDFLLRLCLGPAPPAEHPSRSSSAAPAGAATRFGLVALEPQPSVRLILWIAGLIVLAAFANPYFEEGAFFPLVVYRKFTTEQAFYSAHIGEFTPPIEYVLRHGLASPYLLAELTSGLVAAASFLVLLVLGRWSPFRLTLFAAFAYLECEAERNSSLFALVAGFVACANFGEIATIWKSTRGGATHTPTSSRPTAFVRTLHDTRGSLIVLSLWLLGSALIVTNVWDRLTGEGRPFGLGESRNWFIHDAAKFAGRAGFPDRAFVAHNGQASVYAYHNGPERRVFMDSRLEVCTERTFRAYLQILDMMAARDLRWVEILRIGADDLPVVILDSRHSRPAINGLLLTPGWRLVFADGSAAVFLDDRRANTLRLPAVEPPLELLDPDGVLRATGKLGQANGLSR